MKVAIVGIYPRDPARIRGGVEAVTLRLSRGLAAMDGIEVHVIVSEAGRPRSVTEVTPGLTVHSIGAARHFGNVLFQLPDRRLIARTLRELAPDIVHAHSAHREALGAIESGLPTVVTIHGILEREIHLERSLAKRFRNLFRGPLVESALRRLRNGIVLSPSVEEHYRPRLPHARLWMIENPVDERFFATAPAEESHTLLFSGLIIPRKGVLNLLEGFARLRRRIPGARLRIAGAASRPAYEQEVHDAVDRLDLACAVDFLGGLSPERLAEEYASAAALVLVSRQDTLPVSIQEAMAVGIPIIASPVGGIPYLVREGETGLLVEHGDPARLAERMYEMLTDDGLRRRLGARAAEWARERFTLEGVCRRTADVYQAILAGNETTERSVAP